MAFPVQRPRRLRRNETIRSMVRENCLSPSNLIYPLFVVHGKGVRREIEAMPGSYHFSVDKLGDEVKEISDLGIPAVLLFGIPKSKDPMASEAYASDGIVQRAIQEIKSRSPETVVITDVCLCEYTEHGHCGIVENGYLVNDKSLELIEKVTLSHAMAGSDMMAPAAIPRRADKGDENCSGSERIFREGDNGLFCQVRIETLRYLLQTRYRRGSGLW